MEKLSKFTYIHDEQTNLISEKIFSTNRRSQGQLGSLKIVNLEVMEINLRCMAVLVRIHIGNIGRTIMGVTRKSN